MFVAIAHAVSKVCPKTVYTPMQNVIVLNVYLKNKIFANIADATLSKAVFQSLKIISFLHLLYFWWLRRVLTSMRLTRVEPSLVVVLTAISVKVNG